MSYRPEFTDAENTLYDDLVRINSTLKNWNNRTMSPMWWQLKIKLDDANKLIEQARQIMDRKVL